MCSDTIQVLMMHKRGMSMTTTIRDQVKHTEDRTLHGNLIWVLRKRFLPSQLVIVQN